MSGCTVYHSNKVAFKPLASTSGFHLIDGACGLGSPQLPVPHGHSCNITGIAPL